MRMDEGGPEVPDLADQAKQQPRVRSAPGRNDDEVRPS
jgi:hypothetical protein